MAIEHRKILELLPWYINGTLAEEERAELEHHLSECLPCNAALKQERRFRELIQNQDSVPIGPEHGVAKLLQKIDRGDGGRGFSVSMPAIGYGLAAALGGVIVWAFLTLSSSPISSDGDFETLSTGGPSTTSMIDIIFHEVRSTAEVNKFVDEIGGVLISGPSDLGRYRIALDLQPETSLEEVLTSLRTDPQVRFVGQSFINESAQGGEDE